jgi:hypothetical protein
MYEFSFVILNKASAFVTHMKLPFVYVSVELGNLLGFLLSSLLVRNLIIMLQVMIQNLVIMFHV